VSLRHHPSRAGADAAQAIYSLSVLKIPCPPHWWFGCDPPKITFDVGNVAEMVWFGAWVFLCHRGAKMNLVSDRTVLSPWEPGLLSMALYAFMVLALVVVLLLLAGWLGEKKDNPTKGSAYECGIIPTGLARFNYSVPFYLVAIDFLIFDVEAAFIFSWAVAFEELGWTGWLKILFFIFVLLIGLVYIWRKGGLDWGPTTTKILQEPGGHS
jgi:NADH-quinone oxidoreductase subunit A